MGALKYWLWLSGQSGLSCRCKAAVIEHFQDAERAFFAAAAAFETIPGVSKAEAALLEKRELDTAERILAECGRQGIDIITMQDARYPKRLKNIFNPPVVLYVKGTLPDVDNLPALAVIGTRSASAYGLKMGRNLSYEISRAGAVVISMLGEGIDREAAKGCLMAGGCCIGVLGTAHEKENALQRDIIASGALISEYPPGIKQQKYFFKERNRIASGLSHGVVVVEAPEKSGTLLFAAEALEQGREIYAVPGNADAPNSVGTIGLIKQGAKPVTCGWDAVEELFYLFPQKLKKPEGPMSVPAVQAEKEQPAQSPAPRQETTIKAVDKPKTGEYIDLREQLSQLNEEQLAIINAIHGEDTHIDDIIERSGISTAKVLAQLTILEIKGYVRRSAGRRISLNIKSK